MNRHTTLFQRRDTGQHFAFQKFQTGAATGGNVRDLVADFRFLHRRNRFAAAHDRCGRRVSGYCSSDRERSHIELELLAFMRPQGSVASTIFDEITVGSR